MPDACTEIKNRAARAAAAKFLLYGGSDEYERIHVQAGEIIYGQRDRALRSDVDEYERVREEIANWAKNDAIAIAGGRATEMDLEFAKWRAAVYVQHLPHPGCHNAILAVRDLDDIGQTLISQQEGQLDGVMNRHPLHPAYLAARYKPGLKKSNTTILVSDGENVVDRSDIGFGFVPVQPENAWGLLERGIAYISVILGDYDPPVAYRVERMEPWGAVVPNHPTLFVLGFRLLFQSKSKSMRLLEKREDAYGMGPRKDFLRGLKGDSGQFLAVQWSFNRSVMREKKQKALRDADRAVFIYQSGEREWSYYRMHLQSYPHPLVK